MASVTGPGMVSSEEVAEVIWGPWWRRILSIQCWRAGPGIHEQCLPREES